MDTAGASRADVPTLVLVHGGRSAAAAETWLARRRLAGLLVTVATVASALLTLAGDRGSLAQALGLTGQCGMLGYLLLRGIRTSGRWCSPTAVAVLAWIALFTVPSIVYAVNPGLLSVPFAPPSELSLDALQIVNLALAATIVGWVRVRGGDMAAEAEAPRPLATPLQLSERRCWQLGAVGLFALAIVLAHAGGPTALISSPDQSVTSTAGLTLVIGVAMCVKFAAGMPLLVAWSNSKDASRAALVGFLVVVAGVGVMLGARDMIAAGLLQFLCLRCWLRGMPKSRIAVPVLLACGILIVFGLGAVKRYGSYRTQHPGTSVSLAGYLTKDAPSQAVGAYVNNYVDTVRLVALTRALVPGHAGYEPLYQFMNVALHVVPAPFRPTVNRNPLVKQYMDPGGGAYAVPLIVSSYLALGAVGVGLVSLLLGWIVGELDVLLAVHRRRGAVALMALACGTVAVPLVMRAGAPQGLAFAAVDGICGVIVVKLATSPRLSVASSRRQ